VFYSFSSVAFWKFAHFCGSLVSDMAANFPLHEMSLEEKLQAMEALWEDLSREPDRIESPTWHQDVLRETESRVESGEATFSDWEKAKVSIRDRLE
jgi:Putative addiction module component